MREFSAYSMSFLHQCMHELVCHDMHELSGFKLYVIAGLVYTHHGFPVDVILSALDCHSSLLYIKHARSLNNFSAIYTCWGIKKIQET